MDKDIVKLQPNPVVAKLNPNMDYPPDTVSLQGYVSESSRAGYIRLYLTLDFLDYYEIPSECVNRRVPLNADDPESPDEVVIDASVELVVVHVKRDTVKAAFLRGAIKEVYLARAAAALEGVPQAILGDQLGLKTFPVSACHVTNDPKSCTTDVCLAVTYVICPEAVFPALKTFPVSSCHVTNDPKSCTTDVCLAATYLICPAVAFPALKTFPVSSC